MLLRKKREPKREIGNNRLGAQNSFLGITSRPSVANSREGRRHVANRTTPL